MKVIIINEDSHGRIGIALNYYHAAKWLIDTNWIDDNTETYDYDTDEWRSVKDILGADWASLMLDTWDLDRFNDFWHNSFSLDPEKVIGTEDE
jgi:hypothetical protein